MSGAVAVRNAAVRNLVNGTERLRYGMNSANGTEWLRCEINEENGTEFG